MKSLNLKIKQLVHSIYEKYIDSELFAIHNDEKPSLLKKIELILYPKFGKHLYSIVGYLCKHRLLDFPDEEVFCPKCEAKRPDFLDYCPNCDHYYDEINWDEEQAFFIG